MFFKCNHPANRLGVKKDATVKRGSMDFNHITYHLFCQKCMADVDIKYAQMIGGVNEFLKREDS